MLFDIFEVNHTHKRLTITDLKTTFKPVTHFVEGYTYGTDDSRVKQIINLVSENNFGQVFITDTQKQRIEKLFNSVDIDHRIFDVIDGNVELNNSQ